MRNVLLTGSNRGIGFAIQKILLEESNFCVFSISKSNNTIEDNNKPNYKFYKCDISNASELKVTMHKILNDSNGIDVVINNAGIGYFDKIENISLASWENLIHTNLSAPFYIISKCVPHMKKQSWGKIINVSSDADKIGFNEASIYCASKYAIRGLSDALRIELKPFNISVTTISPGRVDTFFNNKMPGDRPNSLRPEMVANQVKKIIIECQDCVIDSIRMSSLKET